MAYFDQKYAGNTMFKPVLDSQVDPSTGTVEGRVGNILSTDRVGEYTNPVVRQSVDRQEQAFNARGLRNSSMAVQAGQEAAISKAVEIATPDAAAYNANRRANVDATNKLAGDELAHGYALDTEALGAANKSAQSSQEFQQGLVTQQQKSQQELERVGAQGGVDATRDKTAQAAEMERLRLSNQSAAERDAANNTANLTRDQANNAVELQKLGQTQAFTQRQDYQKALANVATNFQRQVDTINSSQMTPEDKNVAIQQAQAQRDGEVAFQNILFSKMPGWQQDWLAQGVPTSGIDVASVSNVDTLANIANDPGQPQKVRDDAARRLNEIQRPNTTTGNPGSVPVTQANFDSEAYLRANPDVAAAVQRGETTAWQHYQNHGIHEQRPLGFVPQAGGSMIQPSAIPAFVGF